MCSEGQVWGDLVRLSQNSLYIVPGKRLVVKRNNLGPVIDICRVQSYFGGHYGVIVQLIATYDRPCRGQHI